MNYFSVKTLVAAIGLVSAAQVAVAAPAPSKISLWKGQAKGFVRPSNACKVVERDSTSFRVAVTKDGILVRLHGNSRVRPSEAVRVGQISRSDLFKGANGAEKYEIDLPKSAVADVSEYVVELKAGAPVAKIANTGVPSVGTYWKALTKNGKYEALYCTDAQLTYILFDVYKKDAEQPIATVGVNMWYADIFRSGKALTNEQADQQIAGEEPQQPTPAPAPAPAPSNPRPSNPATAPSRPSAPTPRPGAVAPVVPSTPPPSTGNNGTSRPAPSLEYVACVSENLQVRSRSLSNVLFTVGKLEPAQPVQAWGSERQYRTINGKRHAFINVKFPNRSGENTGWVAESYIKLKSDCAISTDSPANNQQDRDDDANNGSTDQDLSAIKGLNDPICCEFPTIKRPTTSYREGMRRFRANRSGGRRLHAANDLYRVKDEAAVAVAPGKVLRGPYTFYQGTSALEVLHPGGFIVRYGEITHKIAPGIGKNKIVKAGQVIGYIGKVNSGCCQPMLHFELYSGSLGSGTLSGGNAFQRRADLLDPTQHLMKWEKKKFGESY